MNDKQALDLDKHSITLHVQHTVFFVPFLPLRRDYNVKLPNFMLYGGQLIDIRRYSPLQWNPEKLRNIWQIEFNQWNKIKCGLKIASLVSDYFRCCCRYGYLVSSLSRSENSERQGYARLIWN